MCISKHCKIDQFYNVSYITHAWIDSKAFVDPLWVEAKATHLVILKACSIGLDCVIFEDDAYNVINFIQNSTLVYLLYYRAHQSLFSS